MPEQEDYAVDMEERVPSSKHAVIMDARPKPEEEGSATSMGQRYKNAATTGVPVILTEEGSAGSMEQRSK